MAAATPAITSADGVSSESRLKLFPVLIRHVKGDDYSVVRIGCRSLTALATSRMGVEAIRLLRKSQTVTEVRNALAVRAGSSSNPDPMPVIDALLKAKMVRSIDARMIQPETPRIATLMRHYLHYGVMAARQLISSAMIRHLPPRFAHALLFRSRARRQTRGARRNVCRAKANLQKVWGGMLSPARIEQLAIECRHEQIRRRTDLDLLSLMVDQKVIRWLRGSVEFHGLENIEKAQSRGRGVILCGLHFSSMYLLMPMLWLRGYSFTGAGGMSRESWDQDKPVIDLEGVPGAGKVRWCTKVDFRGALEILKTLHRGGMALIYPDGYIDRSGKEVSEYFGNRASPYRAASTPVRFLNQWIAANTAAPWFHLESGAAVVPIKVLRLRGSRFQVIVEPELDLSEVHDLDSIAALIYKTVERNIYLHPDQWSYWDKLQELAAH
jgi:lauroyl/myristoyl acyltransferase